MTPSPATSSTEALRLRLGAPEGGLLLGTSPEALKASVLGTFGNTVKLVDESALQPGEPNQRMAVDSDLDTLLLRRVDGTDLGLLLGAPARLAALPNLELDAPPPSPSVSGPVRRLLALDIDGVLIDADRSFMEAVARTVSELRPTLPWGDASFRAFKRLGGFNNDFKLAAGALALAEAFGDQDVVPRIEAAMGEGFPELEPRIAVLEDLVKPVVQRHYEDTISFEKAFATLEELQATGFELAILTGRPPEELAMAWRVLGFELPAIPDRAPHLRKPSPCGLLQLADAFQATDIVFAGDTVDDASCLRRAAEIRPELRWRFAAIGPERQRFERPEDFSFAFLRELLPVLQRESA
ncbi:MAG: family HAD-type hydrolase [Holophagaceae bacterium]|nr:family HAD-type hydrolase [Holophagaceae bacterium]